MHEIQKNQMKNLLKIISIFGAILFLNSCETQSNIAPQQVTSLLQSKEFTFMAEKANPTNYDVVKVLNSLPNSSASQILNLDSGYTLEIKKDEIIVQLPYFGRMYNPTYSTGKDSYRFTSKDFTMNEAAVKKGSTIFTIFPKDQQNIRRMDLEVYQNGKAYLTIDSNDRQSISYDGYITQNVPPKK